MKNDELLFKYVVNIDDKYGYKGACWYYSVMAKNKQEAIELTKKQHPKFENFQIIAFRPKNETKNKIGELIYYEGDPRL